MPFSLLRMGPNGSVNEVLNFEPPCPTSESTSRSSAASLTATAAAAASAAPTTRLDFLLPWLRGLYLNFLFEQRASGLTRATHEEATCA